MEVNHNILLSEWHEEKLLLDKENVEINPVHHRKNQHGVT